MSEAEYPPKSDLTDYPTRSALIEAEQLRLERLDTIVVS